jgi:hypothetical protein
MENNVYVSGFSNTSTGFQNFSVNTDPRRFKGIQIDNFLRDKQNQKNFLLYKIISWHFSFEKVFKIEYIKLSLHIGDIIDFITKITGIKKLIIKLTNGNCGCEQRRIKFNKWFFIPLLKIKLDKLSYADQIELDSNKLRIQYSKELYQPQEHKKEKFKKIIEEQIKDKPQGHAAFDWKQTKNTEAKPKKGCGCAAKKLTKLKRVVE